MSTHEILELMIDEFRASHPKDPKCIYLGHTEWNQLVASAGDLLSIDSSGKSSFKGITVVRVAETNHLNVA